MHGHLGSLSTATGRTLCSVTMLIIALARPGTIDEAGPVPQHTAVSTPRPSVVSVHHPAIRHVAAATPTPDVRAILARARQQQALRRRAWLAQVRDDFSLHGVGNQLYTAWNAPITLKAINWYGFEYAPFVPDGLDHASLDSILFTVRRLGFNALRITFADETVETNPVVTSGLDANPGLRRLHALDIMERILLRAHHVGLRVILCNSRSEAGRGPEIASGLWYTNRYTASMWASDWMELATRFRHESAFVGADLRNEPHVVGSSTTADTYFQNGPIWGAYHGTYYNDRDWHYAAQTLGNSLLAINPHLLIIVEGVQMYLDPMTNQLTGGLWGSNLIGVQYDRIELTRQSQVVYSIHEYGPHMWQGDWFSPTTTYASLAQRWTDLWGYLLNANSYLRAPIFVGEFGTCHNYWSCISDTDGWKQGFWFQSFVRYLHEHPEVGWAYWSLNANGPFHPQDPNFYSLLSSDWHHYYPLVVQGLAPLLSEADGTLDRPAGTGLQAFGPQPGCFPNRSCVGATAPQTAARPGVRVQAVKVVADVPYVQPADPYRKGDLYIPQTTGSAARPAVVVVHGGSWNNGRKGTPGTVILARGLAQNGYVTFDINYRLSGRGGQYPRNIQDVQDAVGYLASQARRLNLDPDKLGVVGVSAGGYLALMAGYLPNAPPHYPRSAAHVRAVGSLFAPVELKASVEAGGGMARTQKLAAYMGAAFDQNHMLYRMASPLRYVQSAVPTIFWYGRSDPTTPLAQTFELYKRLKQRQIRSQLMDLPGAPRRLTQLSAQTQDTVLHQLLAFLDDVLYRPTPWGG